MRLAAALALTACFAFNAPLIGATHKTTAPHSHATKKASKAKCQSCPRDSHGKIKRSQSAKCAYLKQLGYANCRVPKGFVLDHVRPLACGGVDGASNFQLQSKAEAAAKDKIERNGCTQ